MTRAYKRIVTLAKLPLGLIERISAHSTRVGAAQDMAASDHIDLLAIMQAGDWKSPIMPARYTRRQNARRSVATRLAEMQSLNNEVWTGCAAHDPLNVGMLFSVVRLQRRRAPKRIVNAMWVIDNYRQVRFRNSPYSSRFE